MNNDLVLINSVAYKNYSVDEVYTFSVVLCDNDIDRDLEYFTSDTLEELSKMFVGVTGIYDHNPSAKNQVARIYSCKTENLSPKKTLTVRIMSDLRQKRICLCANQTRI